MRGNAARWEKLGRILAPDPQSRWLATHAGPSCAVPIDGSSLVDVYVTGRDANNRSLIGRVRIDLERPDAPVEIPADPVLNVGDLGAFDENGVSYPCVVTRGDEQYLYYTGWMPTVLTPFQNHLGLAVRRAGGQFERISRAPILERTDADYLSIGSSWVAPRGDGWQLWYTSFLGWGSKPGEPKHRYVIKHATSADGVRWHRENRVCIDLERPDEFSICRPSVYQRGGLYHMWYCSRGEQYRLGYAHSTDGIEWTRADELVGIEPSPTGWDSEAQCYPNVFEYGGYLYMLYCGNGYGRDGLGLARLALEI